MIVLRIKQVPRSDPNAEGEWTEHHINELQLTRMACLEGLAAKLDWARTFLRDGYEPVQYETFRRHY